MKIERIEENYKKEENRKQSLLFEHEKERARW